MGPCCCMHLRHEHVSCMCIHTYRCIYEHVYMHIYIHTYVMYVYMHIYIHTYVIHMYEHHEHRDVASMCIIYISVYFYYALAVRTCVYASMCMHHILTARELYVCVSCMRVCASHVCCARAVCTCVMYASICIIYPICESFCHVLHVC